MRRSMVTAIQFATFCVRHAIDPDALAQVIDAHEKTFLSKTEKQRDIARSRLANRVEDAGLRLTWIMDNIPIYHIKATGEKVHLPPV